MCVPLKLLTTTVSVIDIDCVGYGKRYFRMYYIVSLAKDLVPWLPVSTLKLVVVIDKCCELGLLPSPPSGDCLIFAECGVALGATVIFHRPARHVPSTV